MDLKKLTGFSTIAELGSINAAAKHLGISQPALSKTLRLLESHYGVPLLVRDRAGAVPTEFGKILLEHARVISAELRKAEEKISDVQKNFERRLNIAVAPAPSMKLLPRALRGFRKEFPDVVITILESVFPKAGEQLSAGAIDIAIGPVVPTLNTAAFKQVVVKDFPLAIVAHSDHPLRTANSLTDIKDAEWLQVGGEGVASSLIRKTFEDAAIDPPRSIVESRSMLSSIMLIRNLSFISILPRELLEDSIAHGLCEIRVREKIAANPCAMMFDQRRPLSRYALAFSKYVERAGGYPPTPKTRS